MGNEGWVSRGSEGSGTRGSEGNSGSDTECGGNERRGGLVEEELREGR